MKQPVLLCYNLEGDRLSKIRLAAMRLKIRIKLVAKEEYARPVGALCGVDVEPSSEAGMGDFDGEMLVMAHFPAGMLQALLGAMRRMGVAPVALKAMLTPTNATWDSVKLHAEIASEHEAMTRGESPLHQA